MKNRIFLKFTAVLSVLCLLAAFLLPVSFFSLDTSVDTVGLKLTETENSVELAAAEPQEGIALAPEFEAQAVEYTEEELKTELLAMLYLNYCYGDSFFNHCDMVQCAALSLSDYAADLPGVGLAVNTCLIEGFVKSFYGIELSCGEIECEGLDGDFVLVPVTDCGSRFFEIDSITETQEGIEVLAKSMTYFGGDGYSEASVRAVFIEDSESEFGFNLIFAELP